MQAHVKLGLGKAREGSRKRIQRVEVEGKQSEKYNVNKLNFLLSFIYMGFKASRVGQAAIV